MDPKRQCQDVRKLIQTMPKGGCEQTLRLISEHLSECQACRNLHAGWQKMEQVLIGSKLWLDEVARRSPTSKSRILTERSAPPSAKRAWPLRPVWAGAVALLLIVIAGASLLLLKEREAESLKRYGTSAPRVGQVLAEAVSPQTLRELAEVVCRHEAPSIELPYAPAAFTSESFLPPSFEQYTLEAEDTLETIAESATNLTWRKET